MSQEHRIKDDKPTGCLSTEIRFADAFCRIEIMWSVLTEEKNQADIYNKYIKRKEKNKIKKESDMYSLKKKKKNSLET